MHAEMRVFQAMDRQHAVVLAFSGQRHGGELRIVLNVETDESRARRIEALLSNLQPVLSVKVLPNEVAARD